MKTLVTLRAEIVQLSLAGRWKDRNIDTLSKGRADLFRDSCFFVLCEDWQEKT
jgi:hypothetical protein